MGERLWLPLYVALRPGRYPAGGRPGRFALFGSWGCRGRGSDAAWDIRPPISLGHLAGLSPVDLRLHRGHAVGGGERSHRYHPSNRALKWRTFAGQRYVLVQTLRRDARASRGAVSLTADRWVAIPSQIAARCAAARCSAMSAAALDLRLKQMLGLPPDGDFRFVNQLWVRSADVFRPCTDPRVTTTTCPRLVPAGGPTPSRVGSTDVATFLWVQANFAWRAPDTFAGAASFSCAVRWTNLNCYGLPWTRLGYAYDWRPGAKEEGPASSSS